MKTNLSYRLKASAILVMLGGAPATAVAQDSPETNISAFDRSYHNWYNLDAQQDNVHGVSVNRAYTELLSNRKSKKTVVVAIIDSGTDIHHEDLKGRIWVNPKEIAGNNQDDDNNGYIDDVHGWGFLGNASGENIKYETYEFARLLRQLSPKYSQVKSEKEVPAAQLQEYKTYLRCKQTYEQEVTKRKQEQAGLDAFMQVMQECNTILAEHLGKKTFMLSEVRNISGASEKVMKARGWLLTKYSQGYSAESFRAFRENNDVYLQQHLNLAYNPRTLVADNPEDINDRVYGNSNVIGPRADHGTPVAGVIAGIRGNNTGIDGIAENVQLMILRAVPQGDERDKDIALAIRYAADNGANIINMSFGKDFSPQKSFIDEAVKYAESKNVLLVHAAGNDGQNIDENDNFPTKQLLDGTRAKNWLEVGATALVADKNFCGVFSNYGKQNVDLFAPGVDIISLAPDNKYDKMDGTSFASPVVSGVAALVWSYYPELSATELKDVLLKSTTQHPKLKVITPNLESAKKQKVNFSELSVTGGVVNAYQALKLAEKLVQEKAPKS
ncbi:S8 family peptidase [Pontibacter sp. H259]|uniref:S8 family peptidase n=1 Tax=Pontibacter sp. H259 TaxID=3133421 RepID=UPI0030C1E0B3